MSSFLQHAEQIFDVARQSEEPEELTIRVSREGGIHIIAGLDYSSCFSGATYRIRRGQGVVQVEGEAAGKSCTLRAGQSTRSWMMDQPMYQLAYHD